MNNNRKIFKNSSFLNVY